MASNCAHTFQNIYIEDRKAGGGKAILCDDDDDDDPLPPRARFGRKTME